MVFNMPPEDWDVVLKVHVYGTFNVVRHAAPIFKEQRFGRIVTFTSVAWLGTMGQSNYGTAKGGIVSFTKAMARELGRYGVTANSIAPQANTRMTMDPGVIEGMKKRLAAGVITQESYDGFVKMKGPEYIPPIITYLCTDDPVASVFNGQVFGAYGGKISIYSDPIEVRAIYKEGLWTLDELKSIVPTSLATGVVNIAPPEKK
jgi:NAD(P)-dependent dehydrogenase (short-subunit alcohol dehydrogenase family)